MFAIIFILISLSAHLVLVKWATTSFPKLARHKRRLQIAAVLLALWPLAIRTLTRFTWNPIVTGIYGLSLIEMSIVVLGLVPMALGLVITRIAFRERARKIEDVIAEEEEGIKKKEVSPANVPLTRREAIDRAVGVAAWGVTGSVLGWGYVRGRHAFEATEIAVKIPGLPKSLDGYTIAQVSDIHTGSFVREDELAEGFAFVRAMKADLIVATGDLVDFEAGWAPLFARALADIPCRDGHYAILGNHDYYANVGRVISSVQAAGIKMLVNDGVTIRADDGGGFALLGVDDLWATSRGGNGPDLPRALSMVNKDAPRILLAHQPRFFELSSRDVALQLSGHTHGGQINPGFRPADLFMKWVAGRYEVPTQDGRISTLYVNRGFGVAGPPSRVGAPPEITKVVLVAA